MSDTDTITRAQATEMLTLLRSIDKSLGPEGHILKALDCIFLASGGWPAANNANAATQGLQLLQQAQEQQMLAESRLSRAAVIPGAPSMVVQGG